MVEEIDPFGKHQMTSTKFQIRANDQNPKPNRLAHWKLEIEIYLEFGLPARSRFGEGRDLVIGISSKDGLCLNGQTLRGS